MNAHPVEDWVEKAEGNYVSALALKKERNKSVTDVICNQCQQCAEKYLKALLVRHGIDFPNTHDLDELEDLVIGPDPDVRLIDKFLIVLNPYGIDIRYPGLRAAPEEAKEAIKAMKEVRKFVRARLGLGSKR
ncbi:MAG: HEPN domain-containing protein [Chloroflexota bacterium]|nr:HEPN domain-containing protein [Chloroflexota bacterium]